MGAVITYYSILNAWLAVDSEGSLSALPPLPPRTEVCSCHPSWQWGHGLVRKRPTLLSYSTHKPFQLNPSINHKNVFYVKKFSFENATYLETNYIQFIILIQMNVMFFILQFHFLLKLIFEHSEITKSFYVNFVLMKQNPSLQCNDLSQSLESLERK